jgi:MFS family permease
LRKIDAHMSILILIYMLNYMDRNNVAVARLRGFEADLGLHGNQYQTTLSILYVGYIGFQIPSNIYLNHFGRPSIYLPVIMALWGMVSCFIGITKNFTDIVLCRFFIGVIEAGFFPGAIFLISRWYTKEEIAKRTALLYVGNLSSNAVNPLIAAGVLDNMQGDLGHAAWEWLFFIEGAITITVAVLAVFILPDFPNNTRWLTPNERFLAQRRLVDDAGEADDDTHLTNWEAFKAAISDPKTHILAFHQFLNVLGSSYNAFVPTIAQTFGYARLRTLGLCVPPWVTSCIGVFFLARSADKRKERTFHIILSTCCTIIGFILAASTHTVAPRYLSLFFMTQSYGAYVVGFAWVSSTLPRPPAKRAVAIAYVNACANIGNIVGPYIFKTSCEQFP